MKTFIINHNFPSIKKKGCWYNDKRYIKLEKEQLNILINLVMTYVFMSNKIAEKGIFIQDPAPKISTAVGTSNRVRIQARSTTWAKTTMRYAIMSTNIHLELSVNYTNNKTSWENKQFPWLIISCTWHQRLWNP